MAVCVAIIGKDNSPKYFSSLNPDDELNFQYKVYSSLDVIEEKLKDTKVFEDYELYFGQLFSTETHKIFGYVTNTNIKLVIVVDSTNTALRDNEVRAMFRKLHTLYADHICNPFYLPGTPIVSKTFDGKVKNIMTGNA
ncbi:trafficking protein particle complex subunit 2-like protein [Chrysoperla carnea]|uniref:trafficking protein particle complex subunit 2-like protein n=1 Tax=Chrysoperla carnea TaxID=189513 RepID=UPI001D0863F9|nr:trafficking protein particle complex subunit 2-like protein [Chrysoperla carnea]